jgi:hypothetical protein
MSPSFGRFYLMSLSGIPNSIKTQLENTTQKRTFGTENLSKKWQLFQRPMHQCVSGVRMAVTSSRRLSTRDSRSTMASRFGTTLVRSWSKWISRKCTKSLGNPTRPNSGPTAPVPLLPQKGSLFPRLPQVSRALFLPVLFPRIIKL